MKNQSEEGVKERNESLPLLLLVTGISSLVFNGMIYLLDGIIVPVFTWVGTAGIILGLLFFVLSKSLK
ncbi:MAG: hypothetical protein IPM85_08710 [Chitinophagaceae bacterium]|nr:hypothetical protein [Chitinophagaceae bacterium]